jgi:four helix bundle protein
MKIYNFEDLVVWQLARELVKDIYAQFATSKDYGFNNQIQRAVISIMNNIAEGFDKSMNSKDNKQLLSYLNISYGSCGEVKSMLYVAEDLDYINAEIARTLRERCTDLSIKLASFMSSLRNYVINKNNRTNNGLNKIQQN